MNESQLIDVSAVLQDQIASRLRHLHKNLLFHQENIKELDRHRLQIVESLVEEQGMLDATKAEIRALEAARARLTEISL